MWLLYFIPSLIIQLFIGPYIDRWSRKWVMVISQWTRSMIFLIPLVAVLLGSLEVWQIYTVQIIIGLISPLYVPANHAITPTIVTQEQLKSANAYIDGTVRIMSFLAPILAGVVIQYLGVNITLMFVSLMLFLSGSTLLLINEQREQKNTARNTWLHEFKEGLHFFFNQRIIVWLGVFLAFVQFGVGVTMVTTLPYITDVLKGSYSDYGYFMAGFPIGYFIGAILIPGIKFKSRRLLMLSSLFIGGMTFFVLSFNYSIYFAITTEIIGGIAMAIFSIHNTTICQQVIPNRLMGKVFSVRLLIIRGTMPLGILIGGVISESLGIRPLYLFIGLLISIVAFIGLTFPYFQFIDNKLEPQDRLYTEIN